MAFADPTLVAAWQGLLMFGLVVLMKIVLFVLGYLTIRLGYKLISAGVEGKFKFQGSFAGFKADLVSLSPGLLFVVLGVLLNCYAIGVSKEVRTIYPDAPQADAAKSFQPPTGNLSPQK